MATKYTEWPQNIPDGRKIDQLAIKYTNIIHCKILQNLPKLGFFSFENMPSGSPAPAYPHTLTAYHFEQMHFSTIQANVYVEIWVAFHRKHSKSHFKNNSKAYDETKK
jgi:hypothetical protein